MKIVLLGSGNTATVLAKLMLAKEHSIVQVWSRNKENAELLAAKIGAVAINSLNEITEDAEICLMAISDEAIVSVASEIRLQKKILIHTAGSLSKEVLKHASANYGVLYPLQSLRKEMNIIPAIPFLVDGNSEEVKVFLYDFAKQLSGSVVYATDTERLHMHLAAVVVNNFSNHLYALAENLCAEQQLNFQLLLPLIQETTQRLLQISAKEAQTGPARRADIATINSHLELLKNNVELRVIYQILSNSILEMYHKKEELR